MQSSGNPPRTAAVDFNEITAAQLVSALVDLILTPGSDHLCAAPRGPAAAHLTVRALLMAVKMVCDKAILASDQLMEVEQTTHGSF